MAYDITALSSALEFDTTQGQYNKLVKIDDTHYLAIWQGGASDGFAQVMELNASTGAITKLDTALEFDTTFLLENDAVLFDGSNHVLVTWRGGSGVANTIILTVNLSTWAVTAEGTVLQYDTAGNHPSVAIIDSTHALVCYQGVDEDGFAQVLEVNTSTWAVTEPASSLEFDTTSFYQGDMIKVDGTRYLVAHHNLSDGGIARVLTVNTSTWAVTATSSLTFDLDGSLSPKLVQLDATHFFNIWTTAVTLADRVAKAQVLTVDASTSAITLEGTALQFHGENTVYKSAKLLTETDTEYIVACAYQDDVGDGNITVFSVNKSTWAVTEVATPTVYESTTHSYTTLAKVSTTRVIVAWGGVDSDGFIQAFDVTSTSKTLGVDLFEATFAAGGIETASVSPVVATFAIPAVTATYESEQTASVSPVTATFAVPAVTATYTADYDASVAPVTATFTVPTVTATYQSVLSATVSPVVATFTVPLVTATSDAEPDTSPRLEPMGVIRYW